VVKKMADVFSKKKRSEVMSHVRSRGNKDTEGALAKLFRRNGITGWRRHVEIRKAESGKQKFKVRPDFIFPNLKLAVFVDGCFWHGCPKHATQPKGNAAFWRRKFSQNITRDLLVTRNLRSRGWRVLRIWEHELAHRNEISLLRRIQRALL
jgi:DNA mismatch endonuclease (patch repair protein)